MTKLPLVVVCCCLLCACTSKPRPATKEDLTGNWQVVKCVRYSAGKETVSFPLDEEHQPEGEHQQKKAPLTAAQSDFLKRYWQEADMPNMVFLPYHTKQHPFWLKFTKYKEVIVGREQTEPSELKELDPKIYAYDFKNDTLTLYYPGSDHSQGFAQHLTMIGNDTLVTESEEELAYKPHGKQACRIYFIR